MRASSIEQINDFVSPFICDLFDSVLTRVRTLCVITREYTNDNVDMCVARLSFNRNLSFTDMRDLLTMCDRLTVFEHDAIDVDGIGYHIGDGDDTDAVFIDHRTNQICIWVRAFA